MSVRFRLDLQLRRGVVQKMLRGSDGLVGTGFRRMAEKGAQRAKANVDRYGRVDTGQMRDTITYEGPTDTGNGLTVVLVAPVRYARYQHDGTRYIRPAPFLADAASTLKPSDFL